MTRIGLIGGHPQPPGGRLLLCLLLLVATACSSRPSGEGFAGNDGSAPDDSATIQDSTRPSNGDGPVLSGDAGGFDAAPTGDAEVFGQSADTLYKLDPMTKALSVVGAFNGCGGVIDIALDKDSNMYATTYDGFYGVDRTTAVCTHIASGMSYPNSLSFVPAGTLDPNVEALVGYQGDQYIRIDTKTGAISNVGTSIGMGYSSSGDIVSVKGGGTYLTVKGTGCATDCLLQVDPKTGSFVKNWGVTGHTDVFGLAFWAGAVYGFDASGNLFEIDFTGATLQVTAIPIPNAPPTLSFYGAGSTTSAPPQANM
jgi:hypothetical protein